MHPVSVSVPQVQHADEVIDGLVIVYVPNLVIPNYLVSLYYILYWYLLNVGGHLHFSVCYVRLTVPIVYRFSVSFHSNECHITLLHSS